VWVSVFNLFAVTVFWSFMADLFTSEQGKRLFGFIGAGGTAGALLGPVITIGLSVPLGPVHLLLAAVVFLEAAVFCVHRLERATHAQRAAVAHDASAPAAWERVGGSAFAALTEVMRSPYLLGIALWVSLLSFGATILYFEQVNIVAATIRDRAQQTQLFASLDLAVNLLTLAVQTFATGKLIARFGVGRAAAALPALYVVGFAALAAAPGLVLVLVLQVLQRTLNFALANPARQVFYTVVDREAKYKAKNLIDVVVFRGSDALYGWVYESLTALGLKIAGISLVCIPVVLLWTVLSLRLGRAHEQRAVKTAMQEVRA
jgi:AAA family ATP:ADP antiporter